MLPFSPLTNAFLSQTFTNLHFSSFSIKKEKKKKISLLQKIFVF